MSVAIRNYKRVDYSYLLNEINKAACDTPAAENVCAVSEPRKAADTDEVMHKKLMECCRNKHGRYKDLISLLERSTCDKSLLGDFLNLDPEITAVSYTFFCFTIGENERRLSVADEDEAKLYIRLSDNSDNGKNRNACERLLFAGNINDILRMLSEGAQGGSVQAKSAPKAPAEPSAARKAIMSNSSVWYVMDGRSEILHEKSCPQIRDIPDEALIGVRRYDGNRQMCAHCRRAGLIRTAIGGSARYLSAYVRFFDILGVSDAQLRRLILNNKTTFSFPAPDTNLLCAEVNDDRWLIERRSNGRVTLWHNDYQVLGDNTRYFTGGFHEQLHRAHISRAIDTMCSYSWANHVAYRSKSAQQAPVQAEQHKAGILSRFTAFVGRIARAVFGVFSRRGTGKRGD